MRARHQVLLSLCIPLLTLSTACSDAAGPLVSPSDAALLHSVTLAPAQATLAAGSHMAITATSVGPDGQATTSGSVQWSTSDAEVATVSGSGDVVAVAPGTAVITASVGGASATAPFTIVPAPPAESVSVAPSKVDVTVGQAVQFSASVGDQAAEKGVVWTSSNADVATVSTDGLVTGVTAGSASIRATYAGRTAEAAVSVLKPPAVPPTPPDSAPASAPTAPSDGSNAAGLWANQPSALKTITDQSWNSFPSDGWLAYTYGNDFLHVVDDPTEPAGDPQVLQFDYPKGYGGGGYGPAVVEYRFSANEAYIGFYWKMSPNWQGHTTGVNKLFYVFQRLNENERQAIFFVARGGVDGPFHFAISNEPDGGKWFTQNVDNVTIQPDRWYKVELHLKRSSSDGAPDGLVEWWVDGQLAARYTDAKLRDEPFSEVHIDPVWGGHDPSTSKSHDDYFRFGHFHVSGR